MPTTVTRQVIKPPVPIKVPHDCAGHCSGRLRIVGRLLIPEIHCDECGRVVQRAPWVGTR